MTPQRVAIWAVLVLVLAGLTACASRPETPQQVINEAKEVVLAVKRTIRQNLEDGFYTPDEAEKRLKQVEAIEKDVVDAETLLKIGQGVQAKDKASVARSVLRNMRGQVEKR